MRSLLFTLVLVFLCMRELAETSWSEVVEIDGAAFAKNPGTLVDGAANFFTRQALAP